MDRPSPHSDHDTSLQGATRDIEHDLDPPDGQTLHPASRARS